MNLRKSALSLSAVAVTTLVLVLILSRPAPPEAGPFSPASPASLTPPVAAPDGLSARIGASRSSEFSALFEEVLRLRSSAERDAAVAALAERWLATDRRGFLDALDAHEVDDETLTWSLVLPGLRQALARLDEKSAESPLIDELVVRMAEAHSEQDPAAAARWITQSFAGERRDQALAAVLGPLATVAPDRARELFAGMTQPARRIEAAAEIGAALAAADPQTALDWAGELSVSIERNLALDRVLSTIAPAEPALAAEGLGRYEDLLRREVDARLASYAEEYANATRLDLGAEDERMTPEAHASEQEAEMARLLAGPGARIARAMAAQDPQAAVQWAASLDEPIVRQRLLGGAVTGWAEAEPEAAWNFARTNLDVEPAVAEPVFESWARQDAARASREAASIRNSAQRDAAVTGVTSAWLEQSPVREVSAWVETLPTGRGRDVARGQVVDALIEQAPVEAWGQAVEIEDAAVRREVLPAAFAAVLENDAAGAREMLASASLADAEARQLRRLLNGATVSAR